MPTLRILAPGEEPRVVEVSGDVTVGRDAACEVFLAEKKSSRRHLRILREAGGWVVEDLDSSNGTYVGPERILRRALEDGLTLRIGDTELAWSDGSAEPLVGGKLLLTRVGPGGASAPPPSARPAAPAPVAPAALPAAALSSAALSSAALSPAAVPAAPVASSVGDPAEPEAPPGEEPEPVPVAIIRPLDMRSFGRGLTVALVGLAALLGVHFILGAKAQNASEQTAARRQLADLLSRSDVDPVAFATEAEHYLQRFPNAPDRALLERHMQAVGSRTLVRQDVEARFETLLARLGSLPEDQVRVGLLSLKRELAEDQGLAERVRLALVELDRRRAALERVEGERVREEARALIAKGLPGPALLRLTAWQSGRGLVSPGETELFRLAREEALAAVDTLAAQTHAAATAETDTAKRRVLLAGAWPALAGTHAQEPLADALRFLSRPPRSTGPKTGPSTGPDPEALAQALLTKAADAERLFGARRWAEARVVFTEVAAAIGVGPLKREWTTRVGDVDRVFALADTLGTAAAGEKPPRVALAAGAALVKKADRLAVTLERAGAETVVPWTDVEPDDVLALLTPAKPEREQRLSVAVLAASVGKPEALVAALAPLYEKEAPGPEVDAAVARLLDGRERAPEGGYRLHRGRLLDRTAYAEAQETERLDGLATRATALIERLAKEPVLKKLERMRELRAELDRRRQVALLAIFNETHYPYPYGRGTPPYTHVQAEVDRRVEAVRELWEGDDHVKLSRTGSAGQMVEEVEGLVKELEAKGRDVKAVQEGVAKVARFMTGESIRLKDFCLDAAEQKLHDYNRWVMEVYNPAVSTYPVDSERLQTAITNDYRMMMGYTATVVPGDAAYQAIDETNVAKVLDSGHIVPGSLVHLRAVRIDERLVKSARGHSVDMQKRGFFDHFAQPNPVTGAPRTSPFDRMRVAGYEGHGASENIAQAGGPKEAHTMWCHSSGHHRNILSPWADMGAGQAGGSLWTQNFGTGGGKPTVIEPAAAPPVTPKR